MKTTLDCLRREKKSFENENNLLKNRMKNMIEKNERYMLSLDYYRAYYNDSNVIFKMSGKIDVRAETDRGLGNSVVKAPLHLASRGLQKPHVLYLQIPQER